MMKKDMMGREIVEMESSDAKEEEVKRKIEELKPTVEAAKKRARRIAQLARVFKKRFEYDDDIWQALVSDYRYCWLVVSSLAFFIGSSNGDNWAYYLGDEAFRLMGSAQKSYLTAKNISIARLNTWLRRLETLIVAG